MVVVALVVVPTELEDPLTGAVVGIKLGDELVPAPPRRKGDVAEGLGDGGFPGADPDALEVDVDGVVGGGDGGDIFKG